MKVHAGDKTLQLNICGILGHHHGEDRPYGIKLSAFGCTIPQKWDNSVSTMVH